MKLTEREGEVLQARADGLSDKEAASALNISVHTVKRHLERIHLKLGVHGTQAAMIAVLDDHVAHDEDGHLTPTEEFDYEAVDRDLFGAEAARELAGCTARELDTALKLFETLLKWQWQNGMRNRNGLVIRSALCCWIFLKELQELTLSDFARGFGMHKQSLGRWHDEFKRHFPQIKTPHMSSIESPKSRVQSPKAGVQSPESKVQSPKSKVQSPKAGGESPKSRGRDGLRK